MCKKPKNQKNRFKSTELMQKFQFGSVFNGKFSDRTEPNQNILNNNLYKLFQNSFFSPFPLQSFASSPSLSFCHKWMCKAASEVDGYCQVSMSFSSSNPGVPPLPPTLHRSIFDTSPSPAKTYARSSSFGDVSVDLTKEDTPN